MYGGRYEGEVPAPPNHFTYGYLGLDWPTEFATCLGTEQSPINIPANSSFALVPDGDDTQLGYGKLTSDGTNINVTNNGHTVQVVLPASYTPKVSVMVKGDMATANLISKFEAAANATATRVTVKPAQFHFHTHSEHIIDGKEHPLEMHIVNRVTNATLMPSCGVTACLTVVGIMFDITDDDTARNPFIDAVIR